MNKFKFLTTTPYFTIVLLKCVLLYTRSPGFSIPVDGSCGLVIIQIDIMIILLMMVVYQSTNICKIFVTVVIVATITAVAASDADVGDDDDDYDGDYDGDYDDDNDAFW